jgi:methionyl-tRNA formyltransferase
MRSALVGAVQSTAVMLDVLVATEDPPLAVFTLPLGLASRHSDFVDLRPFAAQAQVPVVDCPHVNAPEALAQLRGLELDILFVIGWSQLIGPRLLEAAKWGCIGFHPGPLPELRGRAVIPWTILENRLETAATLFWIDEGTDSGDLIAQERFAVRPDETAQTLMTKHLEVLRRMAVSVMTQIKAGSVPRVPQDHSRASWCARRTPEDGWIDWRRPAREVWTLVRAVGRPYPGAFTTRGTTKMTVWSADLVETVRFIGIPGQVQHIDDTGALVMCGDRALVRLREVEMESGPPVSAREVLKLHQKLGLDSTTLLGLLPQEKR